MQAFVPPAAPMDDEVRGFVAATLFELSDVLMALVKKGLIVGDLSSWPDANLQAVSHTP